MVKSQTRSASPRRRVSTAAGLVTVSSNIIIPDLSNPTIQVERHHVKNVSHYGDVDAPYMMTEIAGSEPFEDFAIKDLSLKINIKSEKSAVSKLIPPKSESTRKKVPHRSTRARTPDDFHPTDSNLASSLIRSVAVKKEVPSIDSDRPVSLKRTKSAVVLTKGPRTNSIKTPSRWFSSNETISVANQRLDVAKIADSDNVSADALTNIPYPSASSSLQSNPEPFTAPKPTSPPRYNTLQNQTPIVGTSHFSSHKRESKTTGTQHETDKPVPSAATAEEADREREHAYQNLIQEFMRNQEQMHKQQMTAIHSLFEKKTDEQVAPLNISNGDPAPPALASVAVAVSKLSRQLDTIGLSKPRLERVRIDVSSVEKQMSELEDNATACTRRIQQQAQAVAQQVDQMQQLAQLQDLRPFKSKAEPQKPVSPSLPVFGKSRYSDKFDYSVMEKRIQELHQAMVNLDQETCLEAHWAKATSTPRPEPPSFSKQFVGKNTSLRRRKSNIKSQNSIADDSWKENIPVPFNNGMKNTTESAYDRWLDAQKSNHLSSITSGNSSRSLKGIVRTHSRPLHLQNMAKTLTTINENEATTPDPIPYRRPRAFHRAVIPDLQDSQPTISISPHIAQPSLSECVAAVPECTPSIIESHDAPSDLAPEVTSMMFSNDYDNANESISTCDQCTSTEIPTPLAINIFTRDSNLEVPFTVLECDEGIMNLSSNPSHYRLDSAVDSATDHVVGQYYGYDGYDNVVMIDGHSLTQLMEETILDELVSPRSPVVDTFSPARSTTYNQSMLALLLQLFISENHHVIRGPESGPEPEAISSNHGSVSDPLSLHITPVTLVGNCISITVVQVCIEIVGSCTIYPEIQAIHNSESVQSSSLSSLGPTNSANPPSSLSGSRSDLAKRSRSVSPLKSVNNPRSSVPVSYKIVKVDQLQMDSDKDQGSYQYMSDLSEDEPDDGDVDAEIVYPFSASLTSLPTIEEAATITPPGSTPSPSPNLVQVVIMSSPEHDRLMIVINILTNPNLWLCPTVNQETIRDPCLVKQSTPSTCSSGEILAQTYRNTRLAGSSLSTSRSRSNSDGIDDTESDLSQSTDYPIGSSGELIIPLGVSDLSDGEIPRYLTRQQFAKPFNISSSDDEFGQ
uniref:Uncharacterized protein n=2 Tax=Spongospora subterranea TaxID=70186 RepID=A0A0H5QLU2_9EUKA|eukprot:CRZ02311.1 hypothetical protein [Spongospora subterranea]